MNLQQLRYFKMACRYHNISRAAESFNISQSSISVAIKNLESEFGVTLIKRQRVGFVLTAEGQKFLLLTEGLLEHAERFESIMETMEHKHKTIKLGIPPMICALMLPVFFVELGKRYPEIKISFSEGGAHEILQKLNDKMLDMALIPVNESSMLDGFDSICIAKPEDVCCVSEKHQLADKTSVSISELSEYPLVMFSNSFYHNDKMTMLFDKANVKANIAYQTTQLSTMEQLILKNVAVGFLFKERAEQIAGIRWLSLEPKEFTNIALVRRKNTHMTEDMKIFLKFLEERDNILY